LGVSFYFYWEAQLILLLQSVTTSFILPFVSFVTLFGEETVLVLFLMYVYWGKDKELGERIAVNLLTASVICPLLKNCFLRLRPYMVISEIRCLKAVSDGDIYDTVLQGYSFPSGHSCSAFTAYGTLAGKVRSGKGKTALALIIALVGVSRFWLGVHFPTDVIAAFIIGIAIILVNAKAKSSLKPGWHYLLLVLICSSGFFYCRTEDYFTCFGLLAGALAGFLTEHRSSSLKPPEKPWFIVTRMLCGLAVFLGINNLLKVTAGLIGLSSVSALYFRSVRYGLSAFLCITLAPKLFCLENRIHTKII